MYKLFLLFFFLICNSVNASEIIVGVGKLGVREHKNNSKQISLEYRSAWSVLHLHPNVGIILANHGERYVYAGAIAYIPITNNCELGLGVAPGIYKSARGKNLGSKFEIKSQAELWLKLTDTYKIGAAIFHLSNARVTKINPGIEGALLQFAVRI